MFNSTFLLIASGCLLGAIQIGVGVALGIWIRRRHPGTTNRTYEIAEAERIAYRLQLLADDMSSSVGEHRTQLEEAGRLLAVTRPSTDNRLADLVAGVIGDVVGANHTLQSRLMSAETRLQEQATEIEAHMSRALTDALTGLANRREFNERLEANLASWRKRGEVFSLLMLDVDHFKQLNDRFGHVAGDYVLTTVAAALRAKLRRADIVARYGGEEFAMLLPATNLDEAVVRAEETLRAIAQATTSYQGVEFEVTVSGGLAMVREGEDAAELVRRADAALYAAKSAGRNCIFVQDSEHCMSLAEFRSGAKAGDVGQSAPCDTAQLKMLLEMIESLVRPVDSATTGTALGDPPTSHEGISLQLADACQELRRSIAHGDDSDVPGDTPTRLNAAPKIGL